MIPPGLEIKTFLDESCPTIAKIPSEWRLVVDVNEDFFHRTNVLAGELRQSPPAITLVTQARSAGASHHAAVSP
jgi:hypothetical protein